MLKKQKRYRRQINLPGFGEEVQEKLAAASVLVAGLGGLGGPVALYLAAAGVGSLIVCDSDVVEESNLNRQVLFRETDLGKYKAEVAGKTLKKLNPHIHLESHIIRLDRKNISSIAKNVDVVADCLDNIPSRLELNQWCIGQDIPLVHAGIEAWGGQLTFIDPPSTPCLACLFGDQQDYPAPVPVMGAVAGALGSMQALEILKFLGSTDHPDRVSLLRNRILLFDGQQMEWSETAIQRLTDCPVCSSLK